MSKITKLFMFSVGMFVVSALLANKTDILANSDWPMHMWLAVWCGFTSSISLFAAVVCIGVWIGNYFDTVK